MKHHAVLAERPGAGDGERKVLLTRQIAFDPSPASVLFAFGWPVFAIIWSSPDLRGIKFGRSWEPVCPQCDPCSIFLNVELSCLPQCHQEGVCVLSSLPRHKPPSTADLIYTWPKDTKYIAKQKRTTSVNVSNA